MAIRLNKLISDAGICSRREADLFIETGRVTVNGKRPSVGQRIQVDDEVLVDGERLNARKYIESQERQQKEAQEEWDLYATFQHDEPANEPKNKQEKERFGRYNKYAAARKARKEGGWKPKKTSRASEEKLLKEAMFPQAAKSGKWGKRHAIINPKSAALRKTSRNNPLNKTRRKNNSRRK